MFVLHHHQFITIRLNVGKLDIRRFEDNRVASEITSLHTNTHTHKQPSAYALGLIIVPVCLCMHHNCEVYCVHISVE